MEFTIEDVSIHASDLRKRTALQASFVLTKRRNDTEQEVVS